MGTCSSTFRPAANLGSSLLASPTSVDAQRLSRHRRAFTVRSPSHHLRHVDSAVLKIGLQRDSEDSQLKRRRKNSMTVASDINLKRKSTSSSTLITSPSYPRDVSLNLSERMSSNNPPSIASRSDSVSEGVPNLSSANTVSSSDITVELLPSVSNSNDKPPISESNTRIAQPTARERLFGTFEHRSPAFKAFYSRPEAFRYENSPFFKTVAKCFHPNMNANTLEGTISKQRGFVLQSEDIRVPEGDSKNQWLGRHVIHFYNSISVFYHRISRLCTFETCPKMHAGSQVEYKWQNDKGQIRTVAAPKYIRLLFAWIDKQISDPCLFPFVKSEEHSDDQIATSSSCGEVMFPEQFSAIAANILRRLWRVIAHLYYGHFKRIKSVGLEEELDFRFYHLAFFVLEFELLPSVELRPLRSLIVMRLPEQLSSKIDW